MERRSKGGKERNIKGTQKNSKSWQANVLHNPGGGDGIPLNKTTGQL